MINTSDAFKAAITADTRRIYLKAVIDITDPDIVYEGVTASTEAIYSKSAELYNKVLEIGNYATLEHNKWLLNGGCAILNDDYTADFEIGYAGYERSNADGEFSTPQFATLEISNCDVLQQVSVVFSNNLNDGVARDLTIEISQGGTVYHSETITDNTDSFITVKGFMVYNPDEVTVTVTKWSLPDRCMRIAEILTGIYETWTNDDIAEFNCTMQINTNGTSLPYGTVSLKMDNSDRRFEPRNKDGLFASLEERQEVKCYIGARLDNNVVEYVPLGSFYLYGDGWKTSNNDLTMQWEFVDIIGLLSNLRYVVPNTLPTTLGGWIASVVSQLGANFADRYSVDPAYASKSATVSSSDAIEGKTCGDIIRNVCMATGTFARADAETGYLTVEPLWTQGNAIDLDNVERHPTTKSNPDCTSIVFKLANDSTYTVGGTKTSSGVTVNIDNPFIANSTKALEVARYILSTYGGNQLETVGRGNPANEVGDVPTVQLDNSNAANGRILYQTFNIQNGVLSGCNTTMLQADGAYLYENRVFLIDNATWTAPTGVSKLRIVLVGGGDGGYSGTRGTYYENGVDGVDGLGGKVFADVININPQQTFSVTIGQGGAKNGGVGGDTIFGSYSSANGDRYSPSYIDLTSGTAFARSGVNFPMANRGDGGQGGKGGKKGAKHTEEYKDFTVGGRIDHEQDIVYIDATREVIDAHPTNGTLGKDGSDGCVIIYYDR